MGLPTIIITNLTWAMRSMMILTLRMILATLRMMIPATLDMMIQVTLETILQIGVIQDTVMMNLTQVRMTRNLGVPLSPRSKGFQGRLSPAVNPLGKKMTAATWQLFLNHCCSSKNDDPLLV